MSNFISLSKAAKEWNVSKGTISTAIKNGALKTKGKTPQGGYKIDVADFTVWYNNDYQNPNKTPSTEPNKTVQLNDNNPLENSNLNALVEAEREMKNFYKEQVTKLEIERDDWKSQAQTLLLAPPKKEEVTTIKAELPKKEQGTTAVFKTITAALIIAVLVGAVLYRLDILQLPTGQGGAIQEETNPATVTG